MSVLAVDNVCLSFGGVAALQNVSLSATKDEILSVIGPNGAGKTSLFNVISGAYQPDSGRVFLYGEDVTILKPHERASRGLQRTFQNLQLFNQMTVLENVVAGRHLLGKTGFVAALLGLPRIATETESASSRAKELLQMMGLDGLRDKRASDLAYGQRKRLELARALASDPALILLDEPAAGLNDRETDDLGEIIVSIREQGTAVVLVEHDMRLVMRISDRVHVLNFGQTLAQGDPKSVAADPRVVEAYLGTEIEAC